MIRKMQNTDINRVADIWLKTNLKAHDFIPEQYWTSNYELVKEMCIFRKNCASVPEERSAIPLQTEQSSAG